VGSKPKEHSYEWAGRGGGSGETGEEQIKSKGQRERDRTHKNKFGGTGIAPHFAGTKRGVGVAHSPAADGQGGGERGGGKKLIVNYVGPEVTAGNQNTFNWGDNLLPSWARFDANDSLLSFRFLVMGERYRQKSKVPFREKMGGANYALGILRPLGTQDGGGC